MRVEFDAGTQAHSDSSVGKEIDGALTVPRNLELYDPQSASGDVRDGIKVLACQARSSYPKLIGSEWYVAPARCLSISRKRYADAPTDERRRNLNSIESNLGSAISTALRGSIPTVVLGQAYHVQAEAENRGEEGLAAWKKYLQEVRGTIDTVRGVLDGPSADSTLAEFVEHRRLIDQKFFMMSAACLSSVFHNRPPGIRNTVMLSLESFATQQVDGETVGDQGLKRRHMLYPSNRTMCAMIQMPSSDPDRNSAAKSLIDEYYDKIGTKLSREFSRLEPVSPYADAADGGLDEYRLCRELDTKCQQTLRIITDRYTSELEFDLAAKDLDTDDTRHHFSIETVDGFPLKDVYREDVASWGISNFHPDFAPAQSEIYQTRPNTKRCAS
ncbi:uncharacterized protein I303_101493 [Kwoniella dejecticola CBS 10117]|uniref:Uncharacterized protein n=1 Tax=Kwoniella dejecticola CBS 10117 TaxID=1296121 RepID=A0A1A6ADN7_9TREE|nr:uncharacterized protein I303_02374 [Kwoniella dejecticola CBS 10117]OBR88154.1 hypothetical protein I303_02374 [Kwoniella dejecticola CBS 10117]